MEEGKECCQECGFPPETARVFYHPLGGLLCGTCAVEMSPREKAYLLWHSGIHDPQEAEEVLTYLFGEPIAPINKIRRRVEDALRKRPGEVVRVTEMLGVSLSE